MFVVTVTYVVPIEEVDAVLGAHREFLRRQYEAGIFLASGPQEPRTGGVILARAETRAALDAVLAQDPFAHAGVARYDVTEFHPIMTCPELDFLKQS